MDRQMPDNTWDLYVPSDVMLVECSDVGCGEAPEQHVSTSSFPVGGCAEQEGAVAAWPAWSCLTEPAGCRVADGDTV